VAPPEDSYYRRDLALVHHRGFGFHARACAPGILALRRRDPPQRAHRHRPRAALLAGEGVQVTVASAFGTEQLPTGLRVLVGRRAA
jgi:hypothetical protein